MNDFERYSDEHHYYDHHRFHSELREFLGVPNPTNLLLVMVGLPRSGKTTIAKQFMRFFSASIVSPDAYRLSLHGEYFNKQAEGMVWASVRLAVNAMFYGGPSVVVADATNTTKNRREFWRDHEFDGSLYETKFVPVDTTAEVCIQRAREEDREDLVHVIDRMANNFQPLDDDEREHVFNWPAFGTYLFDRDREDALGSD